MQHSSLRYRSLLLGAGLALAATVTACGSGSGNTQSATSGEAVDVHITASEFKFTSDTETFKSGVQYHFIVENTGDAAHEVMVMPPVPSGKMTMKAMDEMALAMIEEEDLGAGTTGSFDYTFTADEIGKPMEFACHLPAHYDSGMKMPITVSG